MSSASSRVTTDHQAIRRWVEVRGAHPASVKATGGDHDLGVIRIDFPGYSGEGKLEPISWEEFFAKFEERHLAFRYQETTARGEKSNFFKLVDRQKAH